MYESIIETKLDRYRNLYRIDVVLVECNENREKIKEVEITDKSPSLFYNAVLKRKSMPVNKSGTGNQVPFKMYLTRTGGCIKVSDVKPDGIAKNRMKFREIFFNMLVETLKERLINSRRSDKLIMSSEDFMIQEALLYHGFKLHNKKDKNGRVLYMGMFDKELENKTGRKTDDE